MCWQNLFYTRAVLLHAAHNAVDQTYLQALSTNTKVPYYAGEQGFITIILIAIISLIVILAWKKHISKNQHDKYNAPRIKSCK